MKDILKPIIVLALVCLIITAAVAGVNVMTKDRIAEIDRLTAEKTMGELIADAEFETVNLDGAECSEIYRATHNSTVKGYIFTSSAFGYGGQVGVMTAVDTDGRIIGVRVVACNDETPGLGQNAKKDSFTEQFLGLNNQNDVNGADAITSATLTTNAVKKAINSALHDYQIINGGVEE